MFTTVHRGHGKRGIYESLETKRRLKPVFSGLGLVVFMGFCRVIKSRSYFKGFQVKFRRRREGKTDYKKRRALTIQDLYNYGAPKYRFVVRRTCSRVICQVVYQTLHGDHVVCSADSKELTRYGMPVGHTNYAAAYATGLLCARRLLKQMNMESHFVGVEEADGESFNIEDDCERKPFYCVLDKGLARVTTGARVFGAMKGAVDGGLNIPHSVKRFPGYDKESKSYDASVHRDRIFASHVAEHMKLLQEEDEDELNRHYANYVKAGITGDNLEETVEKVHAAIRANPERVKAERKQTPVCKRDGTMIKTSTASYPRPKALDKDQRYQRLQKKLALYAEKMAEEEDSE